MTPQPTEALRNGQIPTQKSSTDQYGRPISVSSLLTPSPQPINVPTPVASPIPDLENILSGFSQPTQTEKDQGTLQSEILKSLDTLGGKKGRQAELEKEAGLGTQRQNLQNIVNQLQGLQKEQAAIPLQFEEQFTGRASVGQIQKMTDSELRRNSIKALGLAAIGQTLQGNIGLAEQSINKALEVEFEPQERRLETLKQLYTFNKDALDREDKKKSDRLNIYLNERARVLKEKKDDTNIKYNLLLQAASNSANPAPDYIMEQARSAETPTEALKLLSPYLTNPLDVQVQLADLEARKASTALTQANILKTKEEIAKLRAEIVGAGDGQPITQQRLSELLDNYSLANEILTDPNLGTAVGKSSVFDPRNYVPGSEVQLTKNKINQLTSLLSLENRQKLKGSGQISDYESRILAQASTALGTNLADEDFENELRKIRGVFATSAGLETIVAITDPKTGSVRVGPANRSIIESAIRGGYQITYK